MQDHERSEIEHRNRYPRSNRAFLNDVLNEFLDENRLVKSSLICNPGGAAHLRATVNGLLTRSMTLPVEALPFLMMLSRTERRLSSRTPFCCTAAPSRTWPMSLEYGQKKSGPPQRTHSRFERLTT